MQRKRNEGAAAFTVFCLLKYAVGRKIWCEKEKCDWITPAFSVRMPCLPMASGLPIRYLWEYHFSLFQVCLPGKNIGSSGAFDFFSRYHFFKRNSQSFASFSYLADTSDGDSCRWCYFTNTDETLCNQRWGDFHRHSDDAHHFRTLLWSLTKQLEHMRFHIIALKRRCFWLANAVLLLHSMLFHS